MAHWNPAARRQRETRTSTSRRINSPEAQKKKKKPNFALLSNKLIQKQRKANLSPQKSPTSSDQTGPELICEIDSYVQGNN